MMPEYYIDDEKGPNYEFWALLVGIIVLLSMLFI